MRTWARLATLVVLLWTGSLLVFLILESLPLWKQEGLGFLVSSRWSVREDRYGALVFVYGSLVTTGLALLWTLPLALGPAILMATVVPPGIRAGLKAVLEVLAAIPGVVYGLLGLQVLAPWVRDAFGLLDGHTLLTASGVLTLMILPLVLTLSEDAFRAVPREEREGALALGLTRWEQVRYVLWPRARSGVEAALLLGAGRALGETIAVMLVIGGVDRFPEPLYNWFQPGQSIPSKLGREASEAFGSGLHWSALVALGLVLFALSTLFTGGIKWLGRGRASG